jgi:hypothetical protein
LRSRRRVGRLRCFATFENLSWLREVWIGAAHTGSGDRRTG